MKPADRSAVAGRPATAGPADPVLRHRLRHQSIVGLALAASLLAAWAVTLAWGLLGHPLSTAAGLATAPLLVLLRTWLNVGLFIVAHDAMHSSLAPRAPGANRAIGRLMLAAYAGFSYDRLLPKHLDHHRHPGTERDPDFDARHPGRFWPWYWRFLRQYFGWREWAMQALLTGALLAAGAPLANLLAFWALPAVLSSLQLFAFGTWLPHRHEAAPFADRHRARDADLPWLASLLTCFHFGHHHAHHRWPGVPWWQLPAVRKAMADGTIGPSASR